jgi:diacylglycerol kinase family enzyme
LADWPLTGERKRAFVVVNESAGGVGPGARERLTKALQDAGFTSLDVREEVHKLHSCRHLANKADVIVVLGGDGTARAAAEAFGDGPPMIILPGGTLNVLPHALYGERSWPDALRDALAGGRVRRLVCGAANGTRFFVAALFGAPTLLATAREAVREGKLLTAFTRFRGAMERTFSRPVEVRPDGTEEYATAPAVGVLCPAYVGEVESDTLEWVRLDASKFTDLARVSLRAVVGGWRDDSTIELSNAKGGRLRSTGVIPATLDGEPHVFVSRVKIEFVRNGPSVVVLE